MHPSHRSMFSSSSPEPHTRQSAFSKNSSSSTSALLRNAGRDDDDGGGGGGGTPVLADALAFACAAAAAALRPPEPFLAFVLISCGKRSRTHPVGGASTMTGAAFFFPLTSFCAGRLVTMRLSVCIVFPIPISSARMPPRSVLLSGSVSCLSAQ